MKQKYIIIIEIVVWLLLLTGAFLLGMYHTTLKDNSKNSYYLFFDDAGGLVKGSPVRLMGVTIGYVRDVKIFDNKVFVSFLVTKKNVSIPHKTYAIIEFYGLGGSTSMELSPKKSVKNHEEDILIPFGVYRIQNYWNNSKVSTDVMYETYTSLGRAIDKSDILNHKDYLKQSKTLEKTVKIISAANEEQAVIIHKMSEMTKEYSLQKQKELDELETDEGENE